MAAILSLSRLTQLAKRTGGVDLLVRNNPFLRPRVARAIERFSGSDAAHRRAITESLLDGALGAACRTQYGREREKNFASWPILTKEIVRDRFPDLCNRGVLNIPAATGGTTGVPVKLIRSLQCVAAEQVFIDSLIADMGLAFSSARIAILRGDKIKPATDQSPPFSIQTHGGKRLILSSFHLNRTTAPSYFAEIEAFAPDILWAYPTTVLNLLRLLAETGKSLSIPVILLSSEQLTAEGYAALESGFGAKVVDYYGLAERVCMAYSVAREKYLFHPAYGKVELLPCEERSPDPERRLARIVATGFWNKSMPFIRYETGDFAIIGADDGPAQLEEIALGMRPFYGIAGRANDFIYGPDDLPIAGINQFSRDVAHVARIQVIQNEDRSVTILTLAMPGFEERDSEALMTNIRAKVPLDIPVTISVAEKLISTESGKTPFILHRYRPTSPRAE